MQLQQQKINIIFLAYIYSYAKILGETNFQHREFFQSGSKAQDGKENRKQNTPGTAGGPGGRDQTLARKSVFFP